MASQFDFFRVLFIIIAIVNFVEGLPIQAASLTQEEARFRADVVSDLTYDLRFDLSGAEVFAKAKEIKKFSAEVSLKFKLNKSITRSLNIDLVGAKISEVIVNDVRLVKLDYNDSQLAIPASALKADALNEIKISYQAPYSKDGSGLYRFEDTEDGNVYLYSDFEPFDANLMFPSFDQPNLKASYKLAVKAPEAWEVVSAATGKPSAAQAGTRLWTFDPTAPFSTYIMSLHAGPYKVFTDAKAEIPSRLLVRQSLAKYVEPEVWFKTTREGLDFYGKYFSYPYPFKKYDQIIVPDFNSGAMENVAAVTFSERFIARGAETLKERERRANVILHEMAHMWFGDLVTMAWWDDLWLNESFATFMATKALVNATEFKNAWLSFFNEEKRWGYWEDQLVTSHPIEVPVAETSQAFANFDGITYGKGAASLKQLNYFIGEKAFQAGLQDYFSKMAFKNATRADFVASLEKASGKNLGQWVKDWLQNKGTNRTELALECHSTKITSLKIRQKPSQDSQVLRSHKTDLLFFKQNKETGRLLPEEHFDAVFSGSEFEVSGAKGLICPSFILLNSDDQDFAIHVLSASDIGFLHNHLNDFENPLHRSLLLFSLGQMLRDSTLDPTKFIGIVTKLLEKEDNPTVLSSLNGSLSSSSDASLVAFSGLLGSAVFSQLEDVVWERLTTGKGGQNTLEWFDLFVSASTSNKSQKRLLQLLDPKQSIVVGMSIDQDRRWQILEKLADLGEGDSLKIALSDVKNDQTTRGKRSLKSIETSLSSVSEKLKILDRLLKKNQKESLADLKPIFAKLFPVFQRVSKEKPDLDFLALKYLSELPRLNKELDERYLLTIARSIPNLCNAKILEEKRTLLAKNQLSFQPVLAKALAVSADEEQRCLAIRKKYLPTGR